MTKYQEERKGKWKKTQKEIFMAALYKYGNNWKVIQKIIKTRSLEQVRSHAQKIIRALTPRQRKNIEQRKARFKNFQKIKQNFKEKIVASENHGILDHQNQGREGNIIQIKIEESRLQSDEKTEKQSSFMGGSTVQSSWRSFPPEIPNFWMSTPPLNNSVQYLTETLVQENLRLLQILKAQQFFLSL